MLILYGAIFLAAYFVLWGSQGRITGWVIGTSAQGLLTVMGLEEASNHKAQDGSDTWDNPLQKQASNEQIALEYVQMTK